MIKHRQKVLEHPHSIQDRRMQKIISELGKHIISIAAIEESRWKIDALACIVFYSGTR
jgi:hypothetical protein